MAHFVNDSISRSAKDVRGDGWLDRRAVLGRATGLAGALAVTGVMDPVRALAQAPSRQMGELDAKAEARKIAFDRVGRGEKIRLISGFPQTRRSWDRLTPLISSKFEAIPADLPSFGDSGIPSVPATTENVGKIFHEFVGGLGAPLHVLAHDFGAWVAYSWALQFPDDFKSLTLIDAGIPGVTLTNDIELSDYKRKWNFMFQMLPDMPAELTKGKEDVYVGWWFNNKVFRPGVIPPKDVAGYVHAYARKGRMDAAFDYCRKLVEDMEFSSRASCQCRCSPLEAIIRSQPWATRFARLSRTSRRWRSRTPATSFPRSSPKPSSRHSSLSWAFAPSRERQFSGCTR